VNNKPKNILITGSCRGIGAAMLRRFYDKGHSVILNYSNSDTEADDLYCTLKALSTGRILKIKADITERIQVETMFEQAEREFGSIDVLINNAGLNIDGPFLEMSEEQWRRVLDVNLSGTFYCAQEFAKRYRGEAGHIINMGASTGLKGRRNGANYCSSKAGVITLTKCLALELAPKIAVNCIIPGFIDTEEVMHRYHLDDKTNYNRITESIPMKRLGTAEDIFRMAEFIIESSSYITGQNFFVNGGNYLG
jgi:acetoacetyl-CoA reductase/3-oxoacyl-[acyl-carrier protein] reductase